MTDDIVHRLQGTCMSAFCGTWEFGGLCPVCAGVAEIERLRALIRQIAPILSSYGDGGVIYPEEQLIIDMIQKEANND